MYKLEIVFIEYDQHQHEVSLSYKSRWQNCIYVTFSYIKRNFLSSIDKN